MMRFNLRVLCLGLVLWPALGWADATPSLERYALVIGANDGGPERVRLRYASSDATAFADIMRSYGGVQPERMLLVLDPDRAAVDAAFADLHRRIDPSRGVPTELVVYYSGHADEKGVLLSGERLDYAALRAHIDAVPARVRIAIVDACASGAMIRAKGGARRPPFLIDRASEVRGHAYLASASADESAQESDRLQASFFSHALLTGLRGAADVSDDRVVTLGEAYQFAFRQTLERTEGTRLGAQHASYDMQLMGSGDVVLTDLRETSADLAIPPELGGRFFIRDAQGRLVAELDKPVGQPMRLGLSPGTGYGVRVETPSGEKLVGSFDLREGESTVVTRKALAVDATAEQTVARGGDGKPTRVVGMSIVPGLATDDGDTHRDLSFNLLVGLTRSVGGFEVGGLVNIVRETAAGVQLAGVANVVGGDVRGAQAAGVANVIGGEVVGVTVGGVGTVIEGRLTGVAGGGVGTYVGADAEGAVWGGIGAMVNGDLVGVAGGGIGTHLSGDLVGVSVGGVVSSVNGGVEGVQLAGITARAGGDVVGGQIGLVTIGGNVSGAQIGLVNIGDRVKGLQLGLVNVADHVDGASVGLVPWVSDGRHHVEVFGTEFMAANVGVRLGNEYMHGVMSLGVNPFEGRERTAFGAGLGGHLPLGRVWLDLDVLMHSVQDDYRFWDEATGVASARLVLGVKMGPISAFAGPTWNVAVMDADDEFDLGFDPLQTHEFDDWTVLAWPGLVAGLQY